MAAHPDVAECAVIGVPTTAQGPGAARARGAQEPAPTRDPAELRRGARGVGPGRDRRRSPRFRGVDVVARLPKTRSGKILRTTMRGIADGATSQFRPQSRTPPCSKRCAPSCVADRAGYAPWQATQLPSRNVTENGHSARRDDVFGGERRRNLPGRHSFTISAQHARITARITGRVGASAASIARASEACSASGSQPPAIATSSRSVPSTPGSPAGSGGSTSLTDCRAESGQAWPGGGMGGMAVLAC